MKRRPKILVVGSFVMDQIARTGIFPNEGETVLGKAFAKAPGGKGANQAVQMARLGADVTMVGKLGCDANGEEMRRICEAAGVHMEDCLWDDAFPSGCSVIVLEEKPGKQTKNRIIVLPGANMQIMPGEISFLRKRIDQYDLLVLQLEIPMEINELAAGYAREAKVPVMLNPAPSAALSPKLLSNISVLSPNEYEAGDMSGIPIPHAGKKIDAEAAKRAAKKLKEKGVENILITLGDAGACFYSQEDRFIYTPAVKGVFAVDPTAAGDSFVGAFSVGSCLGWGTEQTLRFAAHAAALTVSSMGAMPSLPTLAEVERDFIKHNESMPDTAALQ